MGGVESIITYEYNNQTEQHEVKIGDTVENTFYSHFNSLSKRVSNDNLTGLVLFSDEYLTQVNHFQVQMSKKYYVYSNKQYMEKISQNQNKGEQNKLKMLKKQQEIEIEQKRQKQLDEEQQFLEKQQQKEREFQKQLEYVQKQQNEQRKRELEEQRRIDKLQEDHERELKNQKQKAELERLKYQQEQQEKQEQLRKKLAEEEKEISSDFNLLNFEKSKIYQILKELVLQKNLIFGVLIKDHELDGIFTCDYNEEINKIEKETTDEQQKVITVLIAGGSQMGKDSLIKNLSKDGIPVNVGNGIDSQTSTIEGKCLEYEGYKIQFINTIGLFDQNIDVSEGNYKQQILLKLLMFFARCLKNTQNKKLNYLKYLSAALIVQTLDSYYVDKRNQGKVIVFNKPEESILIKEISIALKSFFETSLVEQNSLLILTQHDLACLRKEDKYDLKRIDAQKYYENEIIKQSKVFVSNKPIDELSSSQMNKNYSQKAYIVVNPDGGEEFYSQFSKLANSKEKIEQQQLVSSKILNKIIEIHESEEKVIILNQFKELLKSYNKQKQSISKDLNQFKQTVEKLKNNPKFKNLYDSDQIIEDQQLIKDVEEILNETKQGGINYILMRLTIKQYINEISNVNR